MTKLRVKIQQKHNTSGPQIPEHPNRMLEHNQRRPQIRDHSHRILIAGDSKSGKTNALLNLMSRQPHLDKNFLYSKDPYKLKYLINKREEVGLKHLKDPKAFIEYSNDMNSVYRRIEMWNPRKKTEVLIVSDDMIANVISNKKPDSVVTKLFIRGKKLNISLVFIT